MESHFFVFHLSADHINVILFSLYVEIILIQCCFYYIFFIYYTKPSDKSSIIRVTMEHYKSSFIRVTMEHYVDVNEHQYHATIQKLSFHYRHFVRLANQKAFTQLFEIDQKALMLMPSDWACHARHVQWRLCKVINVCQ